MCGITGIYAFNREGEHFLANTAGALRTLARRGPDGNGFFTQDGIALGHTRLAVIDTSEAASQPFTDVSGRYTIVFNGEFFNYREHRKTMETEGIRFRSTGDTEVLLYLYIRDGAACLNKVHGFFSMAIYDAEEHSLFLARDRYGIKPLLIYRDEDKLIFASEMKALLAYDIPKQIDETSLYSYFQLNYIPPPYSIFRHVSKPEPATWQKIFREKTENGRYYTIPLQSHDTYLSGKTHAIKNYAVAQQQLASLLDEAVQQRLVSDVPLGAFLSGGIDSSVITTLASKHVEALHTFSIGFRDEPHFDETYYAQLVAKKCGTHHETIMLSNEDLYGNLHQMLAYIDEPFADSSALNVHILGMHVKKHVTVALSGDGADELFGGYHKHRAEFLAREKGDLLRMLKYLLPVLNLMPKSRHSSLANKTRQLHRLAEGAQLSPQDRYWQWASLCKTHEALSLLKIKPDPQEYAARREAVLSGIHGKADDMNDVFYTDMKLVLQGDMLPKVDLMSMANSLEVRTPFLDYSVVDFAFSLPSILKVDAVQGKRILRDAFRDQLPPELYLREKKGFEVPLLKWFRTELKETIVNDLLSERFIEEQGIFDPLEIKKIIRQLFSSNPGDIHARVWALIVFQHWWKNYFL